MVFSFLARRKVLEIHPYLRRLCDLTAPKAVSEDDALRAGSRYNRTIPTLICPWQDERPLAAEAMIALTKDLSDFGLGVVMTREPWVGSVVVGFWPTREVSSRPWFFRGQTRRGSEIGGGYWLVGVELEEFMEDRFAELESLMPLAQQLLPPETLSA